MSRSGPRQYWGVRISPSGPRLYGGLRLGPHISVGTSTRIVGPFSRARGGRYVRGASHLGQALLVFGLLLLVHAGVVSFWNCPRARNSPAKRLGRR
jgi:hypothetical protein